MSEENVELIRRAYATFNETQEMPWDSVASDVVVDGTGAAPDVGVISDRDASAQAVRSYVETFEDYSIRLDEVVHASEEHVVTAVVDGGRIKGGTQEEVHQRFFHCFTFRDGLVVRWSSHTSRQQALAAAGLSE